MDNVRFIFASSFFAFLSRAMFDVFTFYSIILYFALIAISTTIFYGFTSQF